jgi:hypothetical protein
MVVFQDQFFRPTVNPEMALGEGKKPLVLWRNFYRIPSDGEIYLVGRYRLPECEDVLGVLRLEGFLWPDFLHFRSFRITMRQEVIPSKMYHNR